MIVEKKFSWKYCMSLSALNTGITIGVMFGVNLLLQPIGIPSILFIIVPPVAFTFLTLHMRYMWSYLTDDKQNCEAENK